MKKAGLIYWLFIICYAVQFQFSGDWMLLGDNTIYYSLMPFFGVVILIYRKLILDFICSNAEKYQEKLALKGFFVYVIKFWSKLQEYFFQY